MGRWHVGDDARSPESSSSRSPERTDASVGVGQTVRFIGLPTRQDVTVGANTVRREWTYYSFNGFKTSETAWFKVGGTGIKTTFAPDSWGNLALATTATNKATTWAYTWGQWWDLRTPEYVVTRDINPEGTVHSVEQDGVLTTYAYDELFRQTSAQTAGTVATSTDYDDTSGSWIRTTRGNAVTTTYLDVELIRFSGRVG